MFAYDEDVRRRGVRSVACLSLKNQSMLIGVLYMENNQISGAFTPTRSAVLTMLAAQAAMAIENGRLYSRLLKEHADRQKMQVELAHVSRVTSLGEMAASIAHEVGQPLAGIMTYGDACLRWLDRETPNIEEVVANVKKIVREGIRAGEIVQRVRAMATKDTGTRTAFSVNELVSEAMSLVQFQASAQRVLPISTLHDGLPPVSGDRVQIQQVIINLAVNAIQAMSALEDHAPRELLFMTSRPNKGSVIISVQDSGPGIADDVMEHLFEAFFTTRREGLGMGLSICRSIVEAHGGRIWAERNPPPRRGSAFFVSLPSSATD